MVSTPAYTVVLNWLEEQLRDGKIRVGDKLPAERALAEHFSISRASVREAIRILDAMGLLRSGTGSGSHAGATVISEPSAALGWALRMHIATQALPVKDVVTTRLMLETQAAWDAASGDNDDHTDRDAILTQAHDMLDRMDDPAMPNDEFHALDAQFHLLLTSLAGNVVLETVMVSLRDATIGYVQETVATLEDWASIRSSLQTQHRGILAAVTERDGKRATRLLRDHINWFYSLVPRTQNPSR
ncbi:MULTISPECIES: FadR/GntR family transcriptional regulator [unclassified Candidatus Sulfotelmatobacter]|uniref:FadR/GntR family transcriptional regulator n=1 Tax=unclassified Candidatus Sulfotelmatobacter TaxID=2635724 RepID=UPI00168259E2|nr:FCD domain-containing protein [Kocuria sp. cx-116]MBD2761596.1 FadR family transcriptional regulator [Kocuria sp. cx-116]